LPEDNFIIYVNRKSNKQYLALFYYSELGSDFQLVGADSISTANPSRYVGVETPLGIHKVSRIADAGDWGPAYGTKGQDVYDLTLGVGMAFHPTNEKNLLGSPASHGCIRMTDIFNEVLDKYNILVVGDPVVVGEA